MTAAGGTIISQSSSNRNEEQLDNRFRYTSSHWLGSEFARLATLSCCLLGIQFCWSVELAYGSPYLSSLGLSKSSVSLVWLAGPISGLIMQPLVGVWSDQCTSPMGRRRPFMIVGTGMVLFSLFTIGWTVEFIESLGGRPSDAKYFAIMSFFIMDFAINAVQACARALIVDVLPGSMQEIGNSWAGRMIGLGNVFGYLMGYLDLVNIFPFFGDKQLKVLTVIAAISLIATVAVTSVCVVEKRIYNSDLDDHELNPLEKTIKSLYTIFKTMFNLPGPIARVCHTQFFSWMGWFPFMFFATSWVQEIESVGKSPIDQLANNLSSGNDSVGDSTRTGSFALVIFAVVSLISSLLLPFVVKNKNNNESNNPSSNNVLRKYSLNLPQWFTLTLAMYGICMLCTSFVWSVTGATVLIAACGIPWSVSMWAPFSLIAEHLRNQNLEGEPSVQSEEYRRLTDIVADDHEHERDDDTVPLGAQISSNNYLSHRPNPLDLPPRYSGTFEEDTNAPQSSHQAEETPPKSIDDVGMILGIHNIYIVIPQLLISLVGSIVFYIYEATKSKSSALLTILKLAGILSLVASFVSLSIWKSKHP